MSNRNIISIHVGQAGIHIGRNTWQLLAAEHQVAEDGVWNSNGDGHNVNLFFSESSSGLHTPRALWVDSDKDAINDMMYNSNLKSMITNECCISGSASAAGNYASGKFRVSKEIHPDVMTSLRRQVESADNCLAIQHFSSCCGGTGSGYSTVLMDTLSEMLPKISRHSHTLIPSANVATSIVEPYNAVLSMAETRSTIDVKFTYDNETLYNLLYPVHSTSKYTTTYSDINHLIAQAISGISLSLCWKGALDLDISSFESNIVPFPFMNMVSCSMVPIQTRMSKLNFTTYGITAESFLTHNEMSNLDPSDGQYISCIMLYRGFDCSAKEAHDACNSIREEFQIPFVPWVPTGFKIAMSPKRLTDDKRYSPQHYAYTECSLFRVVNHTGMKDVRDHVMKKYHSLLENRGYVFWYIGEGMEEGEFVDAHEKLESDQELYIKSLQAQSENDDESEDDDDY